MADCLEVNGVEITQINYLNGDTRDKFNCMFGQDDTVSPGYDSNILSGALCSRRKLYWGSL